MFEWEPREKDQKVFSFHQETPNRGEVGLAPPHR